MKDLTKIQVEKLKEMVDNLFEHSKDELYSYPFVKGYCAAYSWHHFIRISFDLEIHWYQFYKTYLAEKILFRNDSYREIEELLKCSYMNWIEGINNEGNPYSHPIDYLYSRYSFRKEMFTEGDTKLYTIGN